MSDDKGDDKYFHFTEGMPTGPDVEVILKAYPDLTIGSVMEREALYALLAIDGATRRGYNRLRSIMEALRHRLQRDHNYVLMFDSDRKAYLIATPEDVRKATPRTIEQIARKARRQRKNLAAVIQHATESERPIIEHQARVMHVLERESKKSNMNLLPPTAAPAAPQIAPPAKKNGNTA